MGFSTSSAAAILFSTMIFLFTVFYTSVNNGFDTVTDGLDTRYHERLVRDDTSFEITSAMYDKTTNELTLEMKNEGSAAINGTFLDVMVNGKIVSASNIAESKLVGSTLTWVWTSGETYNIRAIPTEYGLNFDAALGSERMYKSVTTNLTTPRNISANANYTYIIDSEDHIDVFYQNGTYKQLINSATSPVLTKPYDLSVAGSYLYVVDDHTHIDRLNLDGSGGAALINTGNGALNRSIFVSTAASKIYVIDYNSTVYELNIYGLNGVFDMAATDAFRGNGDLTSPRRVYVEEYVYIIDSDTHVDVFNTDGTTKKASLITGLSSPTGIAVSDKDFPTGYDKVYIANNSNEIRVFDVRSTYADTVAGAITYGLSTNNVYGVDVTGRIFVSDRSNGLIIENAGARVKVISGNGQSATVII